MIQNQGLWFFCDFSITKTSVDRASCVFLSCHSEDSSPVLPVVVSLCADSLWRGFKGYIEVVIGKRRDLEKISTTSTVLQFRREFSELAKIIFFFMGY